MSPGAQPHSHSPTARVHTRPHCACSHSAPAQPPLVPASPCSVLRSGRLCPVPFCSLWGHSRALRERVGRVGVAQETILSQHTVLQGREGPGHLRGKKGRSVFGSKGPVELSGTCQPCGSLSLEKPPVGSIQVCPERLLQGPGSCQSFSDPQVPSLTVHSVPQGMSPSSLTGPDGGWEDGTVSFSGGFSRLSGWGAFLSPPP